MDPNLQVDLRQKGQRRRSQEIVLGYPREARTNFPSYRPKWSRTWSTRAYIQDREGYPRIKPMIADRKLECYRIDPADLLLDYFVGKGPLFRD